MDKSFWGPPIWVTIHSCAALYTPDKDVYFKALLGSLIHLLPCSSCRGNMITHIKEDMPPIEEFLNNNERLFYWTWKLHEVVNKEIGKPEFPYESAKKMYLS